MQVKQELTRQQLNPFMAKKLKQIELNVSKILSLLPRAREDCEAHACDPMQE